MSTSPPPEIFMYPGYLSRNQTLLYCFHVHSCNLTFIACSHAGNRMSFSENICILHLQAVTNMHAHGLFSSSTILHPDIRGHPCLLEIHDGNDLTEESACLAWELT